MFGEFIFHSFLRFMFFIVIRFDNIDSHMIRIIIVVDKIVDVDPIDDIRFHIVIMSG